MKKLRADQEQAIKKADAKSYYEGQEFGFNKYSDQLEQLKPLLHHKSYFEGYLKGHFDAHERCTLKIYTKMSTHLS